MPVDGLIVRSENANSEELAAIHAVNVAAFGREDEAELVDRLRQDGDVLASLVAVLDRHIAGHILFSRMSIETAAGSVPAVALAPMAVLPDYQRRGIGGRLIQEGLDLLREQGERIVIVLGHPEYYPRFGFSSDKARSLESPFPRDAYFALDLEPGALDDVRGKVKYPAAFGSLT